MSRILPPSSTPLERAVTDVAAGIERIPVPLRDLWDPWAIPADLLPFLAWSLSVEEEWNFAQTEEEQRALVSAAVELHRYKGTPHALRYGLRSLGFDDAEIIEGEPVLRHDGTVRRDGIENYNAGRRWALFSVVLDLGDTNGFSGQIAQRVRTVLNTWKNARSHLHRIELRASLSEHRETDAIAVPCLHVALGLRSYRPGFRNATYRRPTPTRYRRDGAWLFDGAMQRNAETVWSGLRFGNPRVHALLDVSLQIKSHRKSWLPRDGAIRFDSRFTRDHQGAVDPTPMMLNINIDDARGPWPEISGFLIYPDSDAWAEGRPLDGPLYGSALRQHPRNGAIARDGARVFGPDEQIYYTQQGHTVFQTVWDYDQTQWDYDTTEWDE